MEKTILGREEGETERRRSTLWSDETSKIKNGKIGNLADFQIVPTIIPEVNEANGGYAIIEVFNGSYIDIYGNYDFYLIDENNVLRIVYTSENQLKPRTLYLNY